MTHTDRALAQPADVSRAEDGNHDGASAAARFAALVPRQLPGPPRWLAGRDDELAALDRLATPPDGACPAVVVICGVPGVGKTALVAGWLHQHREQFRDGQLYARLDGPHGPGETAREVLGSWLRVLGVPAAWVPASSEDRERLWRSVTAGRRLAILIDDAPSVAVVRALLPGTGPAMVLVTSDRMLGGGRAGGFMQVRLGPLKRRPAAALLTRELGADQAAMPAVRELVRVCGGLPLALRCAARLAARSHQPASRLLAPLQDEQARLIICGVARAQAQALAVIEVACQQLEPAAVRALRLLALCPGPEVSPALAAAALNMSRGQAGALLDTLAAAALLEQPDPSRCHFHPLIQRHAREQANRTSTEAERRAVTSQILTWYAHAATAATATLTGRDPSQAIDNGGRQGGNHAAAATARWLDRNQPSLQAGLAAAAARRDHSAVLRLASALWPLLRPGGCYDGQLTVARLGARAACACGDKAAEARMLARTGVALNQLGQPRQAARFLRRAARLWCQIGDHAQLAATLHEHGHTSMALDHPAEAITSFTQALETFQRVGREPDIALTLISLGEALTATGQEAQSVARLRQARAILFARPDFYQQARAQAALGTALTRYPQAATAHLEHALSIMRRLGALPEQAVILETLGDVARDKGQPGDASRRYRQALAILPCTHPAVRRLRDQLTWPQSSPVTDLGQDRT